MCRWTTLPLGALTPPFSPLQPHTKHTHTHKHTSAHRPAHDALRPGYVLKSQMKELLEAEAAKNSRDITEVIEEERSRVEGRTPITEEVWSATHVPPPPPSAAISQPLSLLCSAANYCTVLSDHSSAALSHSWLSASGLMGCCLFAA